MLKRDRGYMLTPKGVRKLEDARRAWGDKHDARCTYEKIRELTVFCKENGLDTGTIRKILKGEKKVDEKSICCLFEAFGLQLEDNDFTSKTIKVFEEEGSLICLASKLLTQLGFDQEFKIIRSPKEIGYRFKNPKQGERHYQLVLVQDKENLGIFISVAKHLLEPNILNLQYWEITEETEKPQECIAGSFFVLPNKKDIFLESLHLNYWNLLEAERNTTGTFDLNKIREAELYDSHYGSYRGYEVLPSILLDEFNCDTLSVTNSYLVLNEDQVFPYSWQVYISSREVLEEFISYCGTRLMEYSDSLKASNDDLPF